MRKIAVVGVGIMGNGIAANYLRNGYEVVVWNRNADKLKSLVQEGAVQVGTPKEAAKQADIVFEVTANDESSRSVWLGKEGIFEGARKDSFLISSATLSIKWSDELIKHCRDKGFVCFDIPLTGGRIGAESGKLTLLAGGDEKRFESLKPDLAAISEKVFYFGKAGSGIRFKLLLNAVQGIHLMAFGEVMKIAEREGMDTEKVGSVLVERMGGGTTAMGWRDYKKVPDPINFSVQWILKDLGYAKEFAGSMDTSLLDEVVKRYAEFVEKGLGEEDWTIITKR